MYKIDEIKMLRLGQRDENLARPLTFDCSDWLEQYPEASIHILFRRPGESAIVPMSTTLEGTTLTWLIHDFEVGKTGVGNAEFRAVDTAGLRRKSRIIPCSIEETLLGDDETVLYTQDQVDETLAHISEAAQAAQAAKASEEAAALSAQEAGESAASAGTAADVATSARDAAQAAQTAAETAQHQAEAAQSGVHADAVAAEQAKVAAQAAQASAQGAASQASVDRTAAESARTDAEAAATHAEAVVEGIDQAGADQVAAVTAAGQAQVTAVNQAGTTQVGNVNAAGTTQVNAVQAKGTQVINSIPADYSALSGDVTDLKSAIDTIALDEKSPILFPLVDNEYVNKSTGAFTPYNNWKRTDYISVNPNETLYFYTSVNSIYNVWYNDNHERISDFQTPQGESTRTVPSTAKYMALSNTNAGMDSLTISRNFSFLTEKDAGHLLTGEPFCAILPPTDSGIISVDTTNKTVTVPQDTLLILDRLYNNLRYVSVGGTIDYSGITSTAVKIYYDIAAGEFVCKYFNQPRPNDYCVLFATLRTSPKQMCVAMPYEIDGLLYGVDFGNDAYVTNYTNNNIKVINHRGYNTVAPENTMPAFKLSRKNKFMYIETDVQFTAPDTGNPNGVAVLIHDATIDRTSDGTGNVADLTYEQLLQYDFGSWKSSKYAGTKIPTLDEFLLFCKNTGVHAYLELKAGNSTQIGMIVNSVKKHGMRKNVTYISQDASYLSAVKTADPSARLGYITSAISSQIITTMTGLKTQENIVFCDLIYTGASDSGVADLIAADISLELWTVNSTTQITSDYATGFATDSARLCRLLYNSAMS